MEQYKTNLLLKEPTNYQCIKSWPQNLRFFVAEWALQHNHWIQVKISPVVLSLGIIFGSPQTFLSFIISGGD